MFSSGFQSNWPLLLDHLYSEHRDPTHSLRHSRRCFCKSSTHFRHWWRLGVGTWTSQHILLHGGVSDHASTWVYRTCFDSLLLNESGVYTNCLFVTLNSREYIRTGGTTSESIALGSMSGPFAINTVCVRETHTDIESWSIISANWNEEWNNCNPCWSVDPPWWCE